MFARLLVPLVLAAPPVVAAPPPAAAAIVQPEARTVAAVASLRLPFVANAGQADPRVAFSASTFAGTVSVTRAGELLYALPVVTEGRGAVRARRFASGRPTAGAWTLVETPVGGRGRPTGGPAGPARVSSFVGTDRARWRDGLPTHEGVEMGEVWPGVSLSVHARGRGVEKVFTVRPGAKPSRIRMRFDGARSLGIDAAGALRIESHRGDAALTPPVAYQVRNGERRPVAVRYRTRGLEYGFAVGRYDPRLPLIIDPLLQATYLGGGPPDECFALAVHPFTGDVIAAGRTYAIDFPGTAGGAQPVHGPLGSTVDSYQDGFVARLDRTLTTLRQATYLGGNAADSIYDVAVHPATGDVFVTGWTLSTDFPVTAGAPQTANAGDFDAFVARLSGDLTALNGATYLGGGIADYGYALAVDAARDRVFVAGQAFSTDFPGTSGGAREAHSGGSSDAFVTVLNTALTALIRTTYLGGAGRDVVAALALSPATGEVVASGYTESFDFPGTAGGAQPVHAGGYDAFAARLDGSLTSLVRATFFGGGGDDFGDAVSLHPATGDVFLGGSTGSAGLPGAGGGARPARAGVSDAFVARLDASLVTVRQSTYLGGSGGEYLAGLVVQPGTERVFVAGGTDSFDFPATAGGAQESLRGGVDTFVARLNAALTRLDQATYLGGSQTDLGEAIALHPATGEVIVAGTTRSPDFPRTAGGTQEEFRGIPESFDAFVARLTPDLGGGAACGSTAVTLCLNEGRFAVHVAWRAAGIGASGEGQAVPLTSDTGYFWFFTANNVELVVKVVDGRGFNGHYWVFYGALSDVEYTITVTELRTGAVRTYFNPQGRLASVADTSAFAAAGEELPSSARSVSGATRAREPSSSDGRGAAECSGSGTSLCLNGGRFLVRVAWRAVHLGTSGEGQAVPMTSDTGYFWFFSANNVELVVKVVDGRSFNGRFWVFYGALSDVEYTITVTDTQTGAVKTYVNPQGTLASVADTAAF